MSGANGGPRTPIDVWAEQEATRRSRQPADDRCPTMLLSFPRSGSHLVRWYIEESLGWSTLGSLDGEWLPEPAQRHDPPLHVRGLVSTPCRLEVAVVKRHYPRDIERFTTLVLIERHPVEAILSHRRDEDDSALPALARGDAERIALLRWTYESFTGPRLHLQFEDFARDAGRLDSALDWLRQHDPRLPPRARDARRLDSAPDLTVRPRLSSPWDPRYYRDRDPGRATVVEDALAAVQQSGG